MKACRVTAFGLVMALCLIAVAPAAHAAGGPRPARTTVTGWPGDWAAGWMATLAGWFGWGADEPRPAGQPQPVMAADKGGCTDGSCPPPLPPPTTTGDCSGSTDPSGTPCNL
jgi:hypothetical protein